MPAIQRWALFGFAAAMSVFGAALFLLPGRMGLLETGATTEFLAHINQSRAGSVVGLGVMAGLYAIRDIVLSGRTRFGFALASLLLAASVWFRWPDRLALGVEVAAAILVAWSLMLFRGPAQAPRDADAHRSAMLRWALISYALFTLLTGLAWLIGPLVAHAKFVALGGLGAPQAGFVRGAADVPIALIALSSTTGTQRGQRLATLTGLLTANLILSIAGFLAQLHDIATPSRWLVEGLHIGWAVCFAVALVRERENRNASKSA